jgi:hypothetical protein
MLPMLAVIVVLPGLRQFATSGSPTDVATVPTEVSLLVHVARVVTFCFVPLLKMAVATKLCEPPALAFEVSGAILMLVRVPALLPLGKNAAAINASTTSRPPNAT